MTRRKSFERLVSHADAEDRRELHGGAGRAPGRAGAAGDRGAGALESDETIRRKTGRGWEQWFDLLDEWDAAERPHKEVALGSPGRAWDRRPGGAAGNHHLRRARGLRAIGEHAGGFAITASKTVRRLRAGAQP
jgi:hypothetical protein